jgi:hypothetical protein
MIDQLGNNIPSNLFSTRPHSIVCPHYSVLPEIDFFRFPFSYCYMNNKLNLHCEEFSKHKIQILRFQFFFIGRPGV